MTAQQQNISTRPKGAVLDEASPRYVGGILIMLNARLFQFERPAATPAGKPQNEVKHDNTNIFAELLRRRRPAGTIHGGDDRHLAGEFPKRSPPVQFLEVYRSSVTSAAPASL